MIPWLIIWEVISQKKVSLSDLISARQNLYPSSGEINFKFADASVRLKNVKEFYSTEAVAVDEMDGLSISFEKSEKMHSFYKNQELLPPEG